MTPLSSKGHVDLSFEEKNVGHKLMKQTDGLVRTYCSVHVNNTHSFVYSTVFMDELLMRMLDNVPMCVFMFAVTLLHA